jgi:hypothetical protein
MRLFKHLAALALLLAAAAPAFADIALPKKPAADKNSEVRRDLPFARMTIERVEGLREARLQIPRARLQELNAAAGVGGGAPSAGIESAGTIVGGVFISLAVVLTGLLLVRSRRGVRVGRAAAAVVLCVCAAGAAAVAAYANAGPPPRLRPQDPGTLVKAVTGGSLAGSIRVEVVEEGTEIKLLVPTLSAPGRVDEQE